ncbi:glutathione S-transferase [Sistotremastrum suecicum HHB10207 ss-3]|uniref:Glutathione S-transferase n=1 Tax=Sistotremastrum suecicum HHB10207 ss-3 TaxID=1314776 RepID=A0A166B576_9AGAM|nr:glutathione S-transferase [Sistotremastrum suecicum HHB10207 ss-3]
MACPSSLGSHGKQFTLFNHVGMHMPNIFKLCFVMKELDLKWESKFLDFNKNEQKQSPHIDYNPNGRIPTLIDHNNNDFPIWESNAILLYLINTYDAENKFGFLGKTAEEKAQVMQWLFFQASGQGPYYGQAHWFLYLHPEEVPSAITRYQDEILRVLSVLEKHLQNREWMVGDSITLADFALLPYNLFYAPRLLPEGVTVEDRYPAVAAWQKRLCARRSVAETVQEREVEVRKFSNTIPIFRGERGRMDPVYPQVPEVAESTEVTVEA